jgi:hypothetical protein
MKLQRIPYSVFQGCVPCKDAKAEFSENILRAPNFGANPARVFRASC